MNYFLSCFKLFLLFFSYFKLFLYFYFSRFKIFLLFFFSIFKYFSAVFLRIPLTVSVEGLHEWCIRSSRELLAAKAFTNHFVVTHDDGQLAAQAGGEEAAIALGQLHEACVLLVAHEQQIPNDGEAPRAGRELTQFPIIAKQPLQQTDQSQEAEEHQQQVLGILLLLHLQLAECELNQVRVGQHVLAISLALFLSLSLSLSLPLALSSSPSRSVCVCVCVGRLLFYWFV